MQNQLKPKIRAATVSASIVLSVPTILAAGPLAGAVPALIITGLCITLVGIIYTFRKAPLQPVREARWRAAFQAMAICLLVYIAAGIFASSRDESGLIRFAALLGGFVVLPIYFGVAYLISLAIIKD